MSLNTSRDTNIEGFRSSRSLTLDRTSLNLGTRGGIIAKRRLEMVEGEFAVGTFRVFASLFKVTAGESNSRSKDLDGNVAGSAKHEFPGWERRAEGGRGERREREKKGGRERPWERGGEEETIAEQGNVTSRCYFRGTEYTEGIFYFPSFFLSPSPFLPSVQSLDERNVPGRK